MVTYKRSLRHVLPVDGQQGAQVVPGNHLGQAAVTFCDLQFRYYAPDFRLSAPLRMLGCTGLGRQLEVAFCDLKFVAF